MHLDVVHLADPRFPGGSSTALASEIRAAAAAGYRQGLVAIKGSVLKRPHAFHPELRELIDIGLCTLLDPDTRISCGLLEVHHPQLLAHLPQAPLRVTAEHRILVVHHPPRDALGEPHYDVARLAGTVDSALGATVLWAPVGPAVRGQLRAEPDGPPLLDRDWVNVLDPAPYRGPREPPAAGPLRLGRHSRPDPLKWPESRTAVLEAYPEDPRFAVQILGGGPFLDELMERRIPTNWSVRPFVPGASADFLRGVEVFVYFHHPRWVEAFGRTILEAMAAGCPAILSEDLGPLFSQAAILAERSRASKEALALRDDAARWRDRSEASRDLVAERFSPRIHVARLRALIGRPSAPVEPVRAPLPPPRVVFFTSNGIGLGHLARCLAIARRLRGRAEPVFVSLSQALRLVRELGYACEHLPFHAQQRLDTATWNTGLREQLDEILTAWRPRVAVLDGNMPYEGFLSAVRRHPGIWLVWSRRGLWRPGSGTVALQREAAFDIVLEPGELPGIVDEGPTALQRERTVTLPPLRLLDATEAMPRERARAALGLPPDGTAVLLQLGSGNNFDFTAFAWRCAELLLRRPATYVVALESPIATAALELPRGVLRRSVFPVARYLRAFDAAVSAAGYNAFHELVLDGPPTLFVPNESPEMDDQARRARHAARRGLALALRVSETARLAETLGRLLDPEEARAIRAAQARLDPANGAETAARLVAEMAWTVRADRP